MVQQITVNNTNYYAFQSAEELLDYAADKKAILIAVNAGKLRGKCNPAQSIINNNIGYADGMGAVWAAKNKGLNRVARIPGCELWLKIIERNTPGKRFYVMGSKPEVLREVVAKLQKEYPGINIVGSRDGYFTPEQEPEIIGQIVKANPDIVFVAMGSPRQEQFMEACLERHPALYMGLGGSFDVYTGNVKRAPAWVRRHKLEGLYRFMLQPRSRFKRFRQDLWFLLQLKMGRY